MNLRDETEIVRRVPLCSKPGRSAPKLFAFTSDCLTFNDGELLFEAGDSADSACVILDPVSACRR